VAEPRDAQGIGEAQVSSWRTTYPGIVAQSYIDSLTAEARAEVWGRVLRRETSPESYVLVAETAPGEVAGFASGGPIRKARAGFDAELYAIYIVKSAQGIGVGRALLEAWAAHEVVRGFRAAVVRVLANNPARYFYERMGARWLEDAMLNIGGEPYPEAWYGWNDLGAVGTGRASNE
jgi:GNAT superfamily N-acetyltransferase